MTVDTSFLVFLGIAALVIVTPGPDTALSLDDVEKGYATLRDLASRTGRRDALGLASRNLLDLTDSAKGAGRAAFQGSVAEVTADVKRVKGMGLSG